MTGLGFQLFANQDLSPFMVAAQRLLLALVKDFFSESIAQVHGDTSLRR
jgi:hypothetical protein